MSTEDTSFSPDGQVRPEPLTADADPQAASSTRAGSRHALAPSAALPGERTVDEALLDQVVDRLNHAWRRKGIETACVLGQVLLDVFFQGDPDHYRTRGSNHVSFRSLAQREDLQMSHTVLWSSVAIVDQLRDLPQDLGAALPLSHHKVLLALHDPEAKRRLARAALEERLTRRALADRVRDLRALPGDPQSSRVGRRPQPAFIKALNQVDAALSAAPPELPSAAAVSAWGAERSRQALAVGEARLAALQALLDGLRGALEALDAEEQTDR